MCDELPCGYESHSGILQVPAGMEEFFLQMGYKHCPVPLMNNIEPLKPLPEEIRERHFSLIKRCLESHQN